MTVAYCRVSSHEQKADLERQAGRVLTMCSACSIRIDRTVTEIGSGLNGRRTKLRKLLSDSKVSTIVRAPVRSPFRLAASGGCRRRDRERTRHRTERPVVIRTYLFALDPTDAQMQEFRSHCGAQRLAYNWCLARVRANWAQRGRWHVSFSVETPDVEPAPRTGGRVLGVDVGITDLVVLSTGEHVPNPRRLDAALRKLRRAQRKCARRRGPDRRRTRAEPSNRWRKARARADRVHTQVVAQRRDHLHKLDTRLVRDFDTIVIEDLYVAGMIRNRRLARHIAGASWAELRRQLTYKAERAGVRLVVAHRWFASSKTCSECGTAKAKLPLSERSYACLICGVVLDRDHNAALNLAQLVREQPEGTGVRPVVLARPAVRRPREESLGTQRHHREVVAR